MLFGWISVVPTSFSYVVLNSHYRNENKTIESLKMKICSLTKSENRTKLMKRFSAAMEEVKPFLTLF